MFFPPRNVEIDVGDSQHSSSLCECLRITNLILSQRMEKTRPPFEVEPNTKNKQIANAMRFVLFRNKQQATVGFQPGVIHVKCHELVPLLQPLFLGNVPRFFSSFFFAVPNRRTDDLSFERSSGTSEGCAGGLPFRSLAVLQRAHPMAGVSPAEIRLCGVCTRA